MKSMYFENDTKKLRVVIDLSVSPKQALTKKTVTLDWDSDGTTKTNPRFEYMFEKEFWHWMNHSDFISVKQFSK